MSSSKTSPRSYGRTGLSYERLKERNPKLVYAALRGFGDSRTGENDYTEWPAFDIIAQAMGGIMSITGSEWGPTKVGPGIGDIVPGIFLSFRSECCLSSQNFWYKVP